jgi:hypothetical protein
VADPAFHVATLDVGLRRKIWMAEFETARSERPLKASGFVVEFPNALTS